MTNTILHYNSGAMTFLVNGGRPDGTTIPYFTTIRGRIMSTVSGGIAEFSIKFTKRAEVVDLKYDSSERRAEFGWHWHDRFELYLAGDCTIVRIMDTLIKDMKDMIRGTITEDVVMIDGHYHVWQDTPDIIYAVIDGVDTDDTDHAWMLRADATRYNAALGKYMAKVMDNTECADWPMFRPNPSRIRDIIGVGTRRGIQTIYMEVEFDDASDDVRYDAKDMTIRGRCGASMFSETERIIRMVLPNDDMTSVCLYRYKASPEGGKITK